MSVPTSAPVPFPSPFWRKIVQESIDALRELDEIALDLSELDETERGVGGIDGGETRQRRYVSDKRAELEREFALADAYIFVPRHAPILSRLWAAYKGGR